MEVILEPINDRNRTEALALRPAPEQAGFVESVEECLAEAAALACWRPVVIREGERIVGFAMYGLFEDEGESGRVWLDRLLIDRCYQGRGLGKAALVRLMARLKAEYGRDELYLSVVEENEAATALYRAFGFALNGERDLHGERVMVWKEKEA